MQLACERVAFVEPNPIELLGANDALVANRHTDCASQQQHRKTEHSIGGAGEVGEVGGHMTSHSTRTTTDPAAACRVVPHRKSA